MLIQVLAIDLLVAFPTFLDTEFLNRLRVTIETSKPRLCSLPLMGLKGEANLIVEEVDAVVACNLSLSPFVFGMAATAGYGPVQSRV